MNRQELPAGKKPLAGKTILVTGASGCIGRTLAQELAQRGAYLILHGRDQNKVAAVDDELLALGSENALLWPLDYLTATDANIAQAIDDMSAHITKIDAVFNCAAITGQQVPVLDESHETWLKVVQTNVEVPRILLKQLLPLLVKAPKAHIIFFINADSKLLYQGAYGLCEHMISKMCEQLNLEFENVNNVKALSFALEPVFSSLRAQRFPGELPDTNQTPLQAVLQVLDRVRW